MEIKRAIRVLENPFIKVDEPVSKLAGSAVYEAVQSGAMHSRRFSEIVELSNGQRAEIVYPGSVPVITKKGLVVVLKENAR